MKALILAGGSGTRLWPVSRTEHPKQFLKLGANQSLLQKTVSRLLKSFSSSQIFILTNSLYDFAMKEQLREIDPALEKNILWEPSQKNTAPAIAFALKYFLKTLNSLEDEVVFVSPSDQMIEPEERFCDFVKCAMELAQKKRIVTFGIHPTHPDPAFGYIEGGAPFSSNAQIVKRFVEKPDFETAKSYLAAGNFYWNSGMFAFRIDTMLEEFHSFRPEIGDYVENMTDFEKLPSLSLDYAVMEQSEKAILLPIDLTWSDVGSWDSVFDFLAKDKNGNVSIGEVIEIDTKNSLLLGEKRLVAAIGLEDILVVETPDVVLIAKKKESQKVKEVVSKLQQIGRKETKEHLTTLRPWGHFTILDVGERHKIKKILVNPGQMLSLQMHFHRSEHWVIVKGIARVTIHGKEIHIHENESIYVPKGSIHRVSNPGKIPLEIIETQMGEYLGEDDIVRLEDIYGRMKEPPLNQQKGVRNVGV